MMTTTVMPDLVNFCANNVTIIVMLYIAVCKPHQYRAITTVRMIMMIMMFMMFMMLMMLMMFMIFMMFMMFMMFMIAVCKPHQYRAITTVRKEDVYDDYIGSARFGGLLFFLLI